MVCRRIVLARTLYAIGAAPCVLDARLSIAAIVIAQLYFVVAPGFRERRQRPAADERN